MITWTVTYRLPADQGGAEVTVPVPARYARSVLAPPRTREEAAWQVALHLGAAGQPHAQLVTVAEAPPC